MSVKRVMSKNADYQKFEVLKTNRNKRYKYGEFLVEGVRSINAAISHGWKFASLLYAEGASLSDWAASVLENTPTDVNYVLSEDLMRELSGKEDTSEIMAIIKMREDAFDAAHLPENPLIVLFDRPSNRGNLGTLIRSCDAMGVDCLLLTGHGVDLYDPEVVVAGMGSFFCVNNLRVPDNAGLERIISELRAKYPGFRTVATTAHKQTALYDENLSGPCLVMIGNETEGLCRGLYDMADTTVSIPMAETSFASSFNVSCAATVILYEITRQRH